MAGSAARTRSSEEENCFSAILRVDGLTSEGALSVEGGEKIAEIVVGGRFFECDFVLGERGADAIAGEHR